MKTIKLTKKIVVNTVSLSLILISLTSFYSCEEFDELFSVEDEYDDFDLDDDDSNDSGNSGDICYWSETFSTSLRAERGVSCGSDTSLKVYFTNPYSYKLRVAFYLRDTNGNLGPNAPYIVSLNPGSTRYHHNCYSDGTYTVLVAKHTPYCEFPILD